MTSNHLEDLLGRTAPFSILSMKTRQQVAALLTERALADGETLIEEGTSGDSLFMVVTGSLALSKRDDNGQSLHLGKIGRGAVIGELALLTGHPRAATIIAETPSIVAALSRASFDHLNTEFPEEMEAVVHWMQAQLHTYQIQTAIDESFLFRGLQADIKISLIEKLRWMELRAGDVLFQQGAPADHLYLVISGRVQLVQADKNPEPDIRMPENESILGEFGKGDVLGAMSIIAAEPQPATALAIRDTQLAVMDRATFDQFLSSSPRDFFAIFGRGVASRLRDPNQAKRVGSPPTTIAMLVCSPAASEFGARIAAAFSAFGRTLHLKRDTLATLFPGRALSAEAAESRLLAWLNDQETSWTHVLYEADLTANAWTFRCLRQADVLLVISEAHADSVPIMARVQSILEHAKCRVETNLILLHQTASESPRLTRVWLDSLPFRHHWHVDAENKQDVQRIARYLDGRAVGIALGGGLAFGLAHVGVVEALRDLQVPIDYVGGTSMGAIVGVGCALHYPRARMMEVLADGCANSLKGDYTLPIISFLSGKKLADSVSRYIGDRDLEDFWLPFFAISSSLVQGRMIIHKRGSALRTILASSRVPGLFPPLGWDNDVLVDGALVNNVPCDVMRAELGQGTVIGVDVSRGFDFSLESFDLHHSGWQIARGRLNPFSRKPKGRPITMANIFMRVMRLGGVGHLRQIRSTADLYLTPPLGEFSFRDFHRAEEMSRIAYDYTVAAMEQWINENGRPWEKPAGHRQTAFS